MDFTKSLLQWYGRNARALPWRRTREAYPVWVSEIMLQQTRAAAVIPYYTRFLAELPDVDALANVPAERLHKLWEGLGYYRRADNLRRAARVVTEKHGGMVPTSYEALLALPGVGPYTAAAVASIAGGERVPAVDGNALRVFARLCDDPRRTDDPALRRAVWDAMRARMEGVDGGIFNQAVMELGATVCLPNGSPLCAGCPVSAHCLAHARGGEGERPVRAEKRPRRVEKRTVFALEHRGAYLVYRRPEGGLLAGLWQLPDADGALDEAEMAAWLAARGLTPLGEWMLYERKHIFTHVEWHMRVLRVRVDASALPDGWEPLDGTRALPTAYRVCLPEK